MKKQILCLIFGGESNEYEVSLKSVFAVLENIDREKYIIYKIGITKDSKWYLFNGEESEIYSGTWCENEKNKPICVDFSRGCFIFEGGEIKPDKIFPVMHGEYGEDGRIQGVCELMHIPMVTSSSFSSFLCMDKYLCKIIAKQLHIPIADYILLYENTKESIDKAWRKKEKWGGYVFVKPTRTGSSVGISRAKTKKELKKAIEKAFEYSDTVLVEEAVCGYETEVGLLENDGQVIASIPGRLSYNSEFYDYETKYHSDSVSYEIPAKIPEECLILCQNYAKMLFAAFGCSSFCRIDFFVCKDGRVIFNEVNSIPGFTKGSMYPMLFEKTGYSFKNLVDKILENVK